MSLIPQQLPTSTVVGGGRGGGEGGGVERGIRGIVPVGAIDANLSSRLTRPLPFHPQLTISTLSTIARRYELPLSTRQISRFRVGIDLRRRASDERGFFFSFCFVDWIFPPPSSLCRGMRSARAGVKRDFFFSLAKTLRKPGSP